MAWRIVRQPNGMLARFSDIVDSFTHMNMSETEARDLCCTYFDAATAREKVRAGVEDWKPWTDGEKGDGLSRWHHDIDTIRTVHGDQAARAAEALGREP